MNSAGLHRAASALHQRNQGSGHGHVMSGKLPSQALYVKRKGPVRCARRTSVMTLASKKVLVPVANGSEETEAVQGP